MESGAQTADLASVQHSMLHVLNEQATAAGSQHWVHRAPAPTQRSQLCVVADLGLVA